MTGGVGAVQLFIHGINPFFFEDLEEDDVIANGFPKERDWQGCPSGKLLNSIDVNFISDSFVKLDFL